MGSFTHCIRHINRCARAYREERLGPLGLHGGQAMFIIHVCRHPGVSQEGLGRHVLLSKSNVTRRLMALEQDGFVRREPDPGDRRVMRVYPTERALALLPEIERVQAEWQAALTEGFTDEEQAVLEKLLERMLARAEALTADFAAGKKEGD